MKIRNVAPVLSDHDDICVWIPSTGKSSLISAWNIIRQRRSALLVKYYYLESVYTV